MAEDLNIRPHWGPRAGAQLRGFGDVQSEAPVPLAESQNSLHISADGDSHGDCFLDETRALAASPPGRPDAGVNAAPRC